jgi:hypothetical protein
MAIDNQAEPEEPQLGAPSLGDKSKLPKIPDLSGRLVQPRRPSPFLLDDFGASSAASVVKP